MVKKLFKHELISYSRILIPVFGIMLLLSIFLRALQLFENESVFYGIVFGFSVFAFVLACIACLFITLVLSVIRFYRNLYTSEGYLTFALPVTNTQHLWIKIITPLLFQITAFITVCVSALIAMGGELVSEIFKAVAYLLGYVDISAIHIVLYILEFLVLLIISYCGETLLFYSCISIGQTRKKNRVGFAVIVYVIYMVIVQILSQAFSIIISVMSMNTSLFEKIGSFMVAHPVGTVHIVLCSSLLFSTIFAVIGFLINRYILNKKLNLE